MAGSVISTAACATSHTPLWTLSPRSGSAPTVAVSTSSRGAHSRSDAPAAARPSAFSSPRPRDPPVTIATRPESVNNSLMVGTLFRLILSHPPHCQPQVAQAFRPAGAEQPRRAALRTTRAEHHGTDTGTHVGRTVSHLVGRTRRG